MVTLETADKALKQVYLGVVADQLNLGVNPFLSKVRQSTADVWGKEIVKLVPYGMNGGIGAGTETGDLPDPAANNYDRFRLELKNLYGTIELSDKAIRASQSSAGAFVNLLNAEMDGLLKASKFNLGRMLYGDCSGKLATTKATDSTGAIIALDSVRNVMEGMVVDYYASESDVAPTKSGMRILAVDRDKKAVHVDHADGLSVADGGLLTVQGSRNNELTGLEAIFSDKDLYGLSRAERSWLQPGKGSVTANEPFSMAYMQERIDRIEELAGSHVDYIVTTYDARRQYMTDMAMLRINLDYMTLDGGFKTLAHNGIPIVADRFVPERCMYLLNSKDFCLHQLCDWRWLEGDGGKIIKQKQGSATYGATLVKYADMICDRPIGQGKIENIRKF